MSEWVRESAIFSFITTGNNRSGAGSIDPYCMYWSVIREITHCYFKIVCCLGWGTCIERFWRINFKESSECRMSCMLILYSEIIMNRTNNTKKHIVKELWHNAYGLAYMTLSRINNNKYCLGYITQWILSWVNNNEYCQVSMIQNIMSSDNDTINNV